MLKLLKPSPNQQYVDLTVSFENEQGDDVLGPPIRFYFWIGNMTILLIFVWTCTWIFYSCGLDRFQFHLKNEMLSGHQLTSISIIIFICDDGLKEQIYCSRKPHCVNAGRYRHRGWCPL